MSSTYSASLKLTLIGDGDQSGIWGQTTNTNLGTLLEQAITGVTTIVMADANYTLTDFNGVSDEARNAVLVITGANSAIRDVIAPLVNKIYIVRNNTSGGYSIRIRGTTGTTVVIQNGASQIVYCNGTDFYAVTTPVLAGAVLPVSNGGTGLTTLTSNNLLVGDGANNVTFIAPGTSGNVLTSNGTSWSSQIPAPEFASGTRILFQQTAAPTGWTKETAYNNYALRLVSGTVGTGGSLGFTSAFSATTAGTVTLSAVAGTVGSTTLSTSQIPAHSHTTGSADITGGECSGGPGYMYAGCTGLGGFTNNAGGGGSHNHSFTFSSGSGSASTNIAVAYVDAVICQKN